MSYYYSACGEFISNNTNSDYGVIASLCPMLYKGYYYDSETGMYYLGSRYYDTQVGRFINGDAYVSTGQGILGLNMFAYCGNNPINRADPKGTHWYFLWIDDLFNLGEHAPKSDVGKAAPYVEVKGSDDKNSPNCYAYAVGSPTNKQPGGSSGVTPKYDNDVKAAGKSVKADLMADGYTVRTIKGPNAKVYDNEFKIALRVGTKPIPFYTQFGEEVYDYHFMRQTNMGQWAEKHGIGGDSILWDSGTPDTIPWTLGGKPYYDSNIIYYAVGVK